jgi:hypothetical protein
VVERDHCRIDLEQMNAFYRAADPGSCTAGTNRSFQDKNIAQFKSVVR